MKESQEANVNECLGISCGCQTGEEKNALRAVTKFLQCQNPDVDSIIPTWRACICARITSDFHQLVQEKKKKLSDSSDLRLLVSFILFQIFGSHWLKANTRLFFFSFIPCTNAACKDVHSKTLSGLPALVIGLSAELAKAPHLAIDRHFPATSADEPARVFDKHLYPN